MSGSFQICSPVLTRRRERPLTEHVSQRSYGSAISSSVIDLRPERAEAGNVLAGPEARARSHLALLRVAVGQIVEDRHARDVLERLGLLHPERTPADHEHELGLVVEADDAFGPHDPGAVADQAGVELDERGRLLRDLVEEVGALQLLEVLAIVLADAEELVGIADRRQVGELLLVAPGAVEAPAVVLLRRRDDLAQPRHRVGSGSEQAFQAARDRRDLGDARRCRHLEDALPEADAEGRHAIFGSAEGEQAHLRVRQGVGQSIRRALHEGEPRKNLPLACLSFLGASCHVSRPAVEHFAPPLSRRSQSSARPVPRPRRRPPRPASRASRSSTGSSTSGSATGTSSFPRERRPARTASR